MRKKCWKTGFTLNLPMGDQLSVELSRNDVGRNVTVEEVWANYEPVTKRHNRSWKSDISRAKYLIRHLGRKKVRELTRADIEEYWRLRADEKTVRGYTPSPQQLNLEAKLLRRSINYAVECGLVASNPITGLRSLRTQNVRQSTITEAQFTELYKAADEGLKPIITLAYDTGMRRGEILKLRWSSVNLREGIIYLTVTKTDRPRVIHLTKRAHRELKKLPISISGYVFVNPKTNRPWYDIRKKWHRACKTACLEGVWFHDNRRSFVTNARRRGVPESVVMKMSGHRTRSVFDRYNVISESDVRDAVLAIETGRAKELEVGIAA